MMICPHIDTLRILIPMTIESIHYAFKKIKIPRMHLAIAKWYFAFKGIKINSLHNKIRK